MSLLPYCLLPNNDERDAVWEAEEMSWGNVFLLDIHYGLLFYCPDRHLVSQPLELSVISMAQGVEQLSEGSALAF